MSKEKQELVKIAVLKPCRDKDTKARYEVGAEVELSQERADAAVAAGLAEIVVPEV